MGLHDGHRKRRKASFLATGLTGMADHEVLELLLFYAIPRRDTNAVAHRLMAEFGSLDAVMGAEAEELQRIPGVGENAAVLLKLLGEVHERLNMPEPPGRIVDNSETAGAYFLDVLKNYRREVLYAMCMDRKGKVLDCRCLSIGNFNEIEVNVRAVVAYVLRWGGDILVLAHNHPSGIALPSQADQIFTQQLETMLQGIGVRLMDHIIVADGDYVSMAQSGILMG
ncbi:MAG: RadC family protein [Oscillospiraceae bacterium]|nr:RadC family protein [Oscillospiraceae bacterium]